MIGSFEIKIYYPERFEQIGFSVLEYFFDELDFDFAICEYQFSTKLEINIK